MNLYSFLRKKHRKPFVGAIFALVFLSSFFVFKVQAQAQAQTASYYEFECLFAPILNRSCNHVADKADVWSGTRSGIAYGKIPKDTTASGYGMTTPVTYVTDTGVKAVTMVLALAMDETKIQDPNPPHSIIEKNYFWSRVADKKDKIFVVRIAMRDPTDPTKTLYRLQSVPAKENAEDATFDANGNIVMVNGKDKDGKQVEIPFFTKGGDRIITKEVIQSTIAIPNDIVASFGTELTADFWYCAGLQNNISGPDQRDGRYAPRGDRVEYFTSDGKYTYKDASGTEVDATDGIPYGVDLCGGTAHYKIGQTIKFNIPSKADVAAEQTTEIDTGIKSTASSNDDTLPACAVTSFGDGSLMGCVARVVYYIFYWPIAWVAGILGKCFDFFLGYSISDESYRANIIVTGWKLVRDISNIFFIIILVWTGFATVFDIGGISMKKVVPALIINALIINFSLFGTQVIIDISNITSRLFYNTMTVCEGDCVWKDTDKGKILQNPNTDTVGGYKSLSSKIVASFNPQTIFKTTTLDSNASLSGKDDGTSTQVNGFNSQSSDANLSIGSSAARYTSDYAGYFIVVTLIAASMMFIIAKMFFGVMFMFAGRVVGLYMVMIFSPFAVLTRGNMPLVGKIKDLAWDSWWDDLTNYALLAPIFVFFLYIIYAFINSDMSKVFVSSLNNSVGFMETVMSIAIPMIIIYMLLGQGVNLAKKYAGKAGEMMQNFGKTASGVAATAAFGGVGVAAGGLAMAGRGTSSVLSKTGLSKWAAARSEDVRDADGNVIQKKSWGAGVINKSFKWGQKSSMDIRNTGLAKTALGSAAKGLGAIGIHADLKAADQVSSAVGIGAADHIGGNVQARKDREKEIEKKADSKTDMSHLTDKQAEEVWKKRTKVMNEMAAEKAWEKDKMAQLESGTDPKGLDKAKADELKAKRDENKAFQKDLTDAIASGNKVDQKAASDKIEKNIKEQVAITAPLVTALMAEKKDDKHKEDPEYKKHLTKAENDTKQKYGDIKNTKDLSAAMRYSYAQRMLEDSLLLSDGEKRKGLWQVGGLLSGGLLANYIDSQQEAAKNVYSKITKGFEKAHNKENKVVNLTNKIKEIDDLIEGHINKVLKDTGMTAKDITDDAERRKHFDKARSDAQVLTDIAKDEMDEFRKDYNKKKAAMTEADRTSALEKLKNLTDSHRKAKDESDALHNAQKDRDKAQDDLDKEKERLSKAEEDKKNKDANKKS